MGDPKTRLEALAEMNVLYNKAVERGDAAQAEQIAALSRALATDSPVQQQALEKIAEGDRLVMAQRWAEARDVLASIDLSTLPPRSQVGVLSNLAFATAQAGDPDRARELLLTAAFDAQARYKEAFERGDLEQAEQFSALMRAHAGGNSPVHVEMEKVGKGERLILAERWADARDVLASIDRSELPLWNRPGVLNNLAYSTAQAGDPERAIELILQAMKEAEAIGPDYPQEKLPFMRGTHGIALGLAGKHEDAISILEPVVAIEKPVRARSIRAYFLGQSYRALGRTTDAVRVFKLAAGGEGPFAKRAQEALAEQNPQEN